MPGVAGKPITIDGSAIHEMSDITLVLTVNGTMSNPKSAWRACPLCRRPTSCLTWCSAPPPPP